MNAQTEHYADYLQLDKILNAQELVSERVGDEKHEEMLFIIVHQAHELWFKQILYELDSINQIFSEKVINDTLLLVLEKRLNRIIVIQNLLLEQLNTLGTMTPMDFLEFRDMLVPASGFQSLQFRLLEIKLGIKRRYQKLSCLNADEVSAIKAAQSKASLFDLVETWLERMPFVKASGFTFEEAYKKSVMERLEYDRQLLNSELFDNDEEKRLRLLELDKTEKAFMAFFDEASYDALLKNGERRLSYQASQAALFIFLYRDHPILQIPYQILSTLIQIDENLTSWRAKHILMVQRMIGGKMGTGGSAGVAYLEKGLQENAFFDLTSLSTFMLPGSHIPLLPKDLIDSLGFRYGQSGEAHANG